MCFFDGPKVLTVLIINYLLSPLISDKDLAYSYQTMHVQWGRSTTFPRQIYMDDLSKTLNKQNTGYMMGESLINNLYADDLVALFLIELACSSCLESAQTMLCSMI